jgi:ssDNA-binding Zn-finger/Zn-ribbon topoisomerase 1
VTRYDKKGKPFVACSGFPKCHYVKPEEFDEKDIVKPCPKCGVGGLVKKRGKYGYYLACTNHENCNYMERITRKKRK